MKRILNYVKNTSIGIQLLSVFVAVGIAMGGVTVVSLSLNYKTMDKYGQYLEYISTIGKLSEIDDASKQVINELIYYSKGDGREKITNVTQDAMHLIEEIRSQTDSVDVSLRLRVVQYLFQQYESKGIELVSLMNEGDVIEMTSQYEFYLETIDILNRIDTYIQEMISLSVRDNKEFLQQTLSNSKTLQYILVMSAMAVLGSAMYLCMKYSRYLEGLIGNILSVTKRISQGNKLEILEVQEGPEEIREIVSSFNQLIMTMEALNREADEKAQLELKLAEEELKRSRMSALLKEAQLQGLQFQIQPHFLFNTLNVISMTAIMENNRKVYDLIMALSKFMRYSLKKATALVTLYEEVDMIAQYLYILKARMGTRLEYKIINEVDEQVDIPLFTLQPIVENAFRHGLEDKVGNGRIIVHIVKRGNRVILRVYNDGIGMSQEELNQLRLRCKSKEIRIDQERHIGIENVVHRLNMLFHDKVDYKIYSNTLRGTLFTIRILLQ